jgi:hypothetical protein
LDQILKRLLLPSLSLSTNTISCTSHNLWPPMKNLEASLPLLFLFYPRTRHGMAIFRNLLIWPSHVATSLP